MRRPYGGKPSPGWRPFLSQHSGEIWACDLFTVQTVWFQTVYVFFIIHHGTRELIHDHDGCFGASFNRRVASLDIRQIRTPVKAPKADAIAERWVRSIRNECLNHQLILGHQHLQRTVDEYTVYYNRWRPHRSLGQIAPRPDISESPAKLADRIIGKPVLGGLHHVYRWAA